MSREVFQNILRKSLWIFFRNLLQFLITFVKTRASEYENVFLSLLYHQNILHIMDHNSWIHNLQLRVEIKKAFEFNCQSFEIIYWFKLSFDKLSLRMGRVVYMISMLLCRPSSGVVHAHKFFMNSINWVSLSGSVSSSSKYWVLSS